MTEDNHALPGSSIPRLPGSDDSSGLAVPEVTASAGESIGAGPAQMPEIETAINHSARSVTPALPDSLPVGAQFPPVRATATLTPIPSTTPISATTPAEAHSRKDTAALPIKKPAKKRSHWIIAGAATLVFAIIAAGVAYGWYYHLRALPGTKVGVASVEGMNRAQVKALVEAKTAKLRVSIEGAATANPTLEELGFHVNSAATVEQVFRYNRTWWRYLTTPFSGHQVIPVTDNDAARTYKYLSALVKIDEGKMAFPARVVINDKKTGFTIVPAKAGEGIDPEPVIRAKDQTLKLLSNQKVTVKVTNYTPNVSAQMLEPVLKEAESFLQPTIKISAKDEIFIPEVADRLAWVKLPGLGSTQLPTIDSEQVKIWVEKAGEEITAKPINGKRNVNAAGKITQVKNQPKDGTQIGNVAEIVKEATTATKTKRPYEGQFAVTVLPAKWEEKLIAPGAENLPYQAAEGEKWIDIDLSAHKVTGYVGTTIVKGPFPAVNGRVGVYDTVEGEFEIYLKYVDQTMRGENFDGSRYVQPDVPWVMYFDGNYSLHGAPWQTSFAWVPGRGSHGCINLQVPVAKELYDWAPLGTAVVSHK